MPHRRATLRTFKVLLRAPELSSLRLLHRHTVDNPNRRDESAGPPMSTYQVFVPYCGKWLSSNATASRKSAIPTVKAWRNAAHWSARVAKLPKGINHVRIMAYIIRDDNRRYDPGNWYPTAKACVDGMVTGYGLCPDDDWTHVTGPDMRYGGTSNKPGVLFKITETEGPECLENSLT